MLWAKRYLWTSGRSLGQKRGLLEQGSFQKSRLSRDSREPPDSEKRRLRPFSRDSREEILEILEVPPVKDPFHDDPFFLAVLQKLALGVPVLHGWQGELGAADRRICSKGAMKPTASPRPEASGRSSGAGHQQRLKPQKTRTVLFHILRMGDLCNPEGPERHLNAARQRLLRDNFCRSIAAQWGQF